MSVLRLARRALLLAIAVCMPALLLGLPGIASSAPSDSAGALKPGLAPIRLGMIEGMSGPFGNTGAAVARNLRFAVDRVNARGGVKLADGRHPLQLVIFDSEGGTEKALLQLQALTDQNIGFVLQGNSSAVASALIAAISRQNQRDPAHRVLFLNYSAVDPALTNADCSFWHFRFDADAAMRMDALTQVMAADTSLKRAFLINQDYSFGHQVADLARASLAQKRPDVAIVGDVFHPIGQVKDFSAYISKIREHDANAVITGNWGNDLTLLVKAAREQSLDARFYTFYGNNMGAPAALGDAGVGRVFAVADWHPNVGGAESDAFAKAFSAYVSQPSDDYPVLRMSVMVDMLAAAIERAGNTEAVPVAHALEGMHWNNPLHPSWMRADNHQLIQPLYVMRMGRVGTPGVRFDSEGSGFGFRTELAVPADKTVMPTTCQMKRPLS
ncbi:MAG: branched-chain amino acid ABC transporter substrate-binding protein [Janthinobacterium lividum]